MAKAAKTEELGTEKIVVEVPKTPRKRRGQPVATQHHTVLTQYTKELSLDELNRGADDDTEDLIQGETDLSEDEDEQEANSVESFLAQIKQSKSDAYFMRVFHLPNYDRDGRSDPLAPGRSRVLWFPFNPATYQDDVALHCARPGWANWFSIEVCESGTMRQRLPVCHVDPAPVAEYQTRNMALPEWYQTAAPAVVGVPTAAPPVDPFAQLQPALNTMAQMMKMFGVSPIQQANNNQAPNPIDDEDRALAYLIRNNQTLQEKVTNGLASKLFGEGASDQHGATWLDLGMEFMKVLPQVVSAVVAVGQQQPQPMPPMQPAQPMQPMPQLENAPPVEAPPIEFVFLSSLVDSCAANTLPSIAVARIVEFESHHPTVSPYIAALLSMSATDACKWASSLSPDFEPIMSTPAAVEWVKELQKGLQTDESA